MSSFAIVQCEGGALSEADAIYFRLVVLHCKQDKVHAFSTVLFKLLGGLSPPRSLNKTSRNKCTSFITYTLVRHSTQAPKTPYRFRNLNT